MKKVIIYFIIGFLMSSVNSSEINYKIIKEDGNLVLKKITIYIRLDKKITETELKNIALELKMKRPKYEKFWIYYLLPEHTLGNGAWATTHFTPNLEVKILGATQESTKELNGTNVNGEILYTWKDDDAIMPSLIFLINENNNLYIKTLFAKNGFSEASEIKEKVTKSIKNGLTKLSSNNPHGEYYILENNGNLGMYDESGKFKEAKKQ